MGQDGIGLNPMIEPHRILLVDDDPFTLTMLDSSLRSLGYEDVTPVRTASEAIPAARRKPPDVAILDLDLGEGPTGIDVAHRLRELYPPVGLVILSTYTEPRLIGSSQRPLPSGTLYLVKQSIKDMEVLRDAIIRSVHAPDPRPATTTSPVANLKDTQIEVMRLVASGLSNAQIAEKLVLKEASVEKAVARLIKQLGIKAAHGQNQRVLIAQEFHRLTKGPGEPE